MGILRVNQVSGDETQLSTLGIGTTTPVTGSVLFDGDGDFLSVASSGDLVLGNTWTVEAWMYFNEVGGGTSRNCILQSGSGVNNSGCLGIYMETGPIIRVRANALGSDVDSSSGVIISNVWHHIAVSCSNNFARIFVDGILRGSGTTNGSVTESVTRIGSLTGFSDYDLNGRISNLRILKGTALYTTDFTPPTTILEPIQDTVLLCCNNPDSAAAVSLAGIGTSRTITVNGDAVASTFNPGLVRNFTSGTQFSGVAKIDTQGYLVPPSGTTAQRGRGVGIIFGGYTSPSSVNNIQYVSIQSTGNAQDFGDLTVAASISGAVSSSTRGISAGGFVSPSPATYSQTIDFVTISTTGNAIKFGDLQGQRGYIAGFSNSTRGVFVSGYKQTPAPAGTTGETDYITIASLGNTQDFGTATFGYYQDAGCSSSTRGLVAGVNNPGGPGHTANIQYVTIATTGNTQTFGDLTQSRRGLSATSSSTRAVFCGGYTGPASHFNIIDYVTISSTGNATDFGDAVFAGAYRGATSNSIRGVFINGYTPSLVNHIDYITISTTGNAQDFGDSLITAYSPSACSDSHGGIS